MIVKGTEYFRSEGDLILALIVGVGLGVGLGWFTFPYLFPLFQNNGLAAWAQAFGAVAAVIGTYCATRAQFKSEREKERRLSKKIENEKIKIQDEYIESTKEIFDWAYKLSRYKDHQGESLDIAQGAQAIYDLWRVEGRIRAEIILQSLKSIPLHEVEQGQRRGTLLHCRIKLERLCTMIDNLSPTDEWTDQDTKDTVKAIYHLSGELYGWHDAFFTKTKD